MPNNRATRFFILALFAISISVMRAQSGTEARLKFDVVSVKPNKSGEAALRFDVQPGRLVAVNMPLKQFIRAAYTLQLYQIAAVPAWVDSERFDISAVTQSNLAGPTVWTPGKFAPVQLMMQSVLADRFKMSAHMERRDALIYALVLRSRDTSKLVPGVGACPPDCGMKIAAGSLIAHNVPLAQFAEFLSQQTGRLVTDSTGLSGGFDFEVHWTPDSVQQSSADAPSLFTALQEQVGLKLEPSRGPVDMLVIEHIEPPTPG
jgi:uncharacterized protein (TIGR03435 family)